MHLLYNFTKVLHIEFIKQYLNRTMFKKRGVSNASADKPDFKQGLNLKTQIQNIELSQIHNGYSNAQKNKHQKDYPSQQNPQSQHHITDGIRNHEIINDDTKSDEEEFINKLRHDKKIQDLFQNIQMNQDQQNQNKNHSPDIQDLPLGRKTKQISSNPNKNKMSPNSNSIFSVINTKDQQPQEQYSQARNNQEINNLFREIQEQNKLSSIETSQKSSQVKDYQQNLNKLPSQHATKTKQFIVEEGDDYVQQIQKRQFFFSETKKQQESMLKVSVDYEGNNLSPQISQNEDDQGLRNNFFQQDFEDELIRKTLTRTNYTKLLEKTNLKQTKHSQQKEKLFNKILKTTWTDIQSRLSSDISSKVNKRNELHKEMKYLEERISQKMSEVTRKKTVVQELQREQKRIKKIIYFMCYFGDQVIGQNETVDTFFDDLTQNVMSKIQRLSDKVGIEQFMQKQSDREKLRQKYQAGRKKMKLNQAPLQNNMEPQDGKIAEQEIQQDDDDDQPLFMGEDDY